jgi:hypothetical protein
MPGIVERLGAKAAVVMASAVAPPTGEETATAAGGFDDAFPGWGLHGRWGFYHRGTKVTETEVSSVDSWDIHMAQYIYEVRNKNPKPVEPYYWTCCLKHKSGPNFCRIHSALENLSSS